ncbi:MAG: hypothetical protein GF347_04285 [Candidatus Moranbacteria bacterium]|nr:hypothetical protein [Candidatus Moranbacteria bacterium]
MAAKGINFAKQTTAYREKKRQKQLMKNMIFGVLMFLIGLGAWIGAYFYKKTVEAELNRTQGKIEKLKEARYSGENLEQVANVVDITTRLNFIGDMAYKQKYWTGFLAELEDRMLKEAYLQSFSGSAQFSREDNTASNQQPDSVNIEVVVPTLNEASKQLYSFFESPMIEDVIINELSLEEIGITFEVELILNKDGLSRAAYRPELQGEVKVDNEAPIENLNDRIR